MDFFKNIKLPEKEKGFDGLYDYIFKLDEALRVKFAMLDEKENGEKK